MVRTQIQLTEQQADYLKRQAAMQDISMAELVRKGVDALMASRTMLSREEVKCRAKAAAGKVRSGGRNLSVRHDEVFAEACRS